MNTIADAFEKALNEKNHFSNFVWKGEKKKVGDKYVQETIKFVDMTPEQLQACYNHCNKMLYNENPKHLGRYNVLEEVTDQINKCNVELLIRYYENAYKSNENRQVIPRSTLNLDLRKLKANSPDIPDWNKVMISSVSKVPAEFNNININDLLDGCIFYLGAFDKVHLTMTFVTKMGLWFTKMEENELKGNSNADRLKTAKEQLHLPSKLNLRFSEKGLSYHEMRAILTLPKRQRYDQMTTEQLLTLRDKILPRFQRTVDGHIFNWEKLKNQIKIVAKERNIQLNDEN